MNTDYMIKNLSDRKVEKMLTRSAHKQICVKCEKKCTSSPIRTYCYGLSTIFPFACENSDCTNFMQELHARLHYTVLPTCQIKLDFFDNNKICVFNNNGKWILDAIRFDTCDFDSFTFHIYHDNPFVTDYVFVNKISINMFCENIPIFNTSMYSDKKWFHLKNNILKHDLCSESLFDNMFPH